MASVLRKCGWVVVVAGGWLLQSQDRADSDLRELSASQSEMRGVVERYVADRGSLSRFDSVEGSPARRGRMKQFYSEWLERLGRLDFDAMSQAGRSEERRVGKECRL